MSTSAEVRGIAELIRGKLEGKSVSDRILWQGVIDLIEKSEFGTKNAEVSVNCPLPPNRNELDEMMDGSFDGVVMEMLSILYTVFRELGTPSVAPYTAGLGTRSMTFKFRV